MNSKRLLDTFFDLVKIDSPSGHEAEVAQYCKAALEKVGCTVEIDDAGKRTGSDTGNIYAVLPGTADATVVLTAHMDCVQPCEGVKPVIEDGVIKSDGTTVLGGDDKSGVAAIIEAVRVLSENDEPHATVKVVFSVQEETGCLGAGAFKPGKLVEGEPCFVFDGDGAPGCATLAAPYHYTFEAEFSGRASHAGVAPEKGISAIEAASRAVALMRERGVLGAVGEYCASNIGTISGGSANNVVAPSCHMTGECRAIDADAVKQVHDGMDAAMHEAADAVGAQVDVEWDLEYAGFMLDETSAAVQLFNRAVEHVGLVPSTMLSAGGTDANKYVEFGVEPLVVSTGMTNFHAVDEYISVADLENTARIAIALAYEAAR